MALIIVEFINQYLSFVRCYPSIESDGCESKLLAER